MERRRPSVKTSVVEMAVSLPFVGSSSSLRGDCRLF